MCLKLLCDIQESVLHYIGFSPQSVESENTESIIKLDRVTIINSIGQCLRTQKINTNDKSFEALLINNKTIVSNPMAPFDSLIKLVSETIHVEYEGACIKFKDSNNVVRYVDPNNIVTEKGCQFLPILRYKPCEPSSPLDICVRFRSRSTDDVFLAAYNRHGVVILTCSSHNPDLYSLHWCAPDKKDFLTVSTNVSRTSTIRHMDPDSGLFFQFEEQDFGKKIILLNGQPATRINTTQLISSSSATHLVEQGFDQPSLRSSGNHKGLLHSSGTHPNWSRYPIKV